MTLQALVFVQGIETIEQLTKLKVMGCHYGQGFLFSRPVTATVATQLLEPGYLIEQNAIQVN